MEQFKKHSNIFLYDIMSLARVLENDLLFEEMLFYLDVRDIVRLSAVNKQMNEIINHNNKWAIMLHAQGEGFRTCFKAVYLNQYTCLNKIGNYICANGPVRDPITCTVCGYLKLCCIDCAKTEFYAVYRGKTLTGVCQLCIVDSRYVPTV